MIPGRWMGRTPRPGTESSPGRRFAEILLEAWGYQIDDLPNKCNASVEPSSETNVRERFLHRREVVGDDEGREEEPAVRSSHTCKFALVIVPSMYGRYAYHMSAGM
jgi:hypothetical protein